MFLTEDVQKAVSFCDFIKQKAHWNLSTADALALTKHFVWFNELVKKIDDHVLEVKRQFEAPKPAAEPEPKKGKK